MQNFDTKVYVITPAITTASTIVQVLGHKSILGRRGKGESLLLYMYDIITKFWFASPIKTNPISKLVSIGNPVISAALFKGCPL